MPCSDDRPRRATGRLARVPAAPRSDFRTTRPGCGPLSTRISALTPWHAACSRASATVPNPDPQVRCAMLRRILPLLALATFGCTKQPTVTALKSEVPAVVNQHIYPLGTGYFALIDEFFDKD